MKNFLEILWNTMGNPWFWVISIAAILVLFFLFRKALKWIPFRPLVVLRSVGKNMTESAC